MQQDWSGMGSFFLKITETPITVSITNITKGTNSPYRGNWVQPFACFASENAAWAIILHEVIVKAIVLLYNRRAVVKNLVCDACSSNKAAMAFFQS